MRPVKTVLIGPNAGLCFVSIQYRNALLFFVSLKTWSNRTILVFAQGEVQKDFHSQLSYKFNSNKLFRLFSLELLSFARCYQGKLNLSLIFPR